MNKFLIDLPTVLFAVVVIMFFKYSFGIDL